MITYELQGTRDAGRVHRAGEVRDIRSGRSARPRAGRTTVPARRVRTRAAGRPAALCPAPVALAPRGVPREFRLRRIVAGVGLAVASAAAVVGLGLLADASSAANAGPAAPAVVLQGS